MRQSRHKSVSNASNLPTITLTPLIDTVLVLLIVFMVTTPTKNMIIKEGNSKEKNEQQNIKKENYQVVLLNIDSAGNALINNRPLRGESLLVALKKALEKSPIRTVVVKVHPRAKTLVVDQIFAQLRKLSKARVLFGEI